MATLGKLLLTIAFFLSVLGGALISYAKIATQDPRPAIGTKKFVIGQGGYPISFFQAGDESGPTVVLLASLGRSVSDFNELAEGLNREGFQTIAIEAPGIGDSGGDSWFSDLDLPHMAKDIGNVISAVVGQERRVFLVGHGFGGQLAQSFAAAFTDRTAGMALLAPGGEMAHAPVMRKALMQIFLPILPENVRRNAIQTAYFSDSDGIPNYWIGGWALKTALLQKKAAEVRESVAKNVKQDLSTLLIRGDSDALAPLSTALALQKRLGGKAKLVTLGRAGHALLPERPKELLQEVTTFITSHNVNR